MNVALGNLGLSACGLFTRIIVTHVSIRTSDTSSSLLKPPSQAYGTLLYHATSASAASVHSLSPVKSSAQDDSTSELLRFLQRMAASKPTSWLSVPSHIVSHLAVILGP